MIKISTSLTHLCLATAVVVTAGCNTSENSDSHTQSKALSSGIIHENMDTLVKPGDNFNAYVNGNWLKKTPIPADKYAVGAIFMLHDKAQEDVKAIIEASSSGSYADGSDEQKIGDMYESYMDMKVRDSIGSLPLSSDLSKIESISSYSELATMFAYCSKIANKTPMRLGVVADLKNPKAYMLFTWQDGLGLPEREYYLLKDAKSIEIRNKYVTHIENLLRLAGIDQCKEKATKIMTLETQLAAKQMKKEQTRDLVAIYNKYAVSDLSKLMPDFDWRAYLKEGGVEKQDSVVIAQVEYTKALNSIIKNTPLDTWKAYLQWSLVHGSATFLNSAIDKEDFNFYGKNIDGVLGQLPLWRRAVAIVSESLGEIVGKVYVKKYFPPQAKERMQTLVDNLLKAYESSIKELTWMSEDTKKQALDKVSKFRSKIGYPDKWRDYSSLKVVKGDLYGNLQRAFIFEYNRNINKLGKPVDRDEWSMTPQTINAYYSPMLNEIVFPASFLQPPQFDMNVDDAVNYGGIGSIIGHEIGHGFDDIGSTFDGNGVMRNWWTEKDKEEFKKRTAALVSQYNQFKVLDDLYVNGEFSLGENIGDLGGLSIALKAYQMSLNGKPAPVLDGFTGEQRVFIGYAQYYLSKETEGALRRQVQTDSHPPAKFRVNGVVRNIPEFYKAFNVQPTDSLYLAPEKRVKIW